MHKLEEKVIDLRENQKEFLLLTLREDGMSTLTYYNKIVKDGVTQEFDSELKAWQIFQALRKALLL